MTRDPNRPPATGPEWNGSRASDVPVEPGGTPNPLEAKKSNDDPPFDFAPPEDIPIDDDVCMDEWMAEAPDEPPTGIGHDPDPADAGKLIPDREVLLQFVALMFKNADTRGYVSLRAFKDNDKRDEGPIFTDPIRLNDPTSPRFFSSGHGRPPPGTIPQCSVRRSRPFKIIRMPRPTISSRASTFPPNATNFHFWRGTGWKPC